MNALIENPRAKVTWTKSGGGEQIKLKACFKKAEPGDRVSSGGESILLKFWVESINLHGTSPPCLNLCLSNAASEAKTSALQSDALPSLKMCLSACLLMSDQLHNAQQPHPSDRAGSSC